ncbi:aminopeptidase [Candidatus Woesearchaeota archaeon]|nr:aminopeptidase [Candidatus Woesearchaeota archaeon]
MTQFEDQLNRYAQQLVHYSLAGQVAGGSLQGITVHLSGEANREKQTLVDLVVREVEQAGGTILNRMHDPRERVALLVEAATASDPSKVIAAANSEGALLDQQNTVYLNIKGVEDPQRYNSVKGISTSAMNDLFWRTLSPYGQKMMRSKPWTVALYPTRAEARSNGFLDKRGQVNMAAFRKAALSPCIDVNYQKMGQDYAELKTLLDDADYIEIITHQFAGTTRATLYVGIEHRVAVFDDGHKNMPGGEMFLTPVTNAVKGSVFTSVPFVYKNYTLNGIQLKFGDDGTVTSYNAVKDSGHNLDAIVKVYDAQGKPTGKTHGIGEVSLGLHPGIDPRMKVPFYTEKRGGVLVLALGNGSEESVPELMKELDLTKRDVLAERLKDQGVFPRASSHVDIPIFDFSNPGNGCEIYVGGKGYRKQVAWDKDTKLWKINE